MIKPVYDHKLLKHLPYPAVCPILSYPVDELTVNVGAECLLIQMHIIEWLITEAAST